MQKFYTRFLFLSLAIAFSANSLFSQVYVRHDATGMNNGASWANAYTDLEDALANASSGDMVWVSAGTYKPGGATPDTLSVFSIGSSISLYGGFDGTETMLSERDPAANVTILSGDINDDDDQGDFDDNKDDNVRHVVYVDSLLSNTTIDGFSIIGGHTSANRDLSFELYSGGGIFCQSPITINDCRFYNNYGSSGGGVFLFGGASGSSVTNCTFTHNYSDSQSAGVLLAGIADATVSDCIFLDNVTNRGALYPIETIGTTINNCRLENNNNPIGFGGGMFSWQNLNLTISNTDFINNSATNAAGIYVDGRELLNNDADNVVFDNCTFQGNTTTDFGGGGMYMFTASMTLENCTFKDNESANGGHLFQNCPNGNIVIRGTNFEGANATGWGGAATAYGLLANYLFEDCLFKNNTVSNLGGAVNNGFGAIATYDGCTFEENESFSSAGGALALQNDSTEIIVKNSTFLNNSASSDGGAIFAATGGSSCIVSVDNSEFLANSSASGFGGAISLSENGDDDISTLTLTNSTFGLNSSPDQGGAVNIGDAETEIISCLFYENFCIGEGRGAALSINASDSNSMAALIVNTTFVDNLGAFADGISQWTGQSEANLTTSIQNCIFSNDGSTNYMVEDGTPIMVSLGGNLSDDSSLDDVLTEPTDITGEAPTFKSPDDYDYSLADGSIGIDAGVAAGAPEFDILGNARINQPDMGAYENLNVTKANERLVENDGMLTVFPNPVRGSIANLTLDNQWMGELEVRLTDVVGRNVSTMLINKNSEKLQFEMPLGKINLGNYHISVSNGKMVVIERIIKVF